MRLRITLLAAMLAVLAAGPAGARSVTGYLDPPPGSLGRAFGFSVDIEGDVVVVGAPRASLDGIESGLAFVYRRGASGWAHAQTLVSPAAAHRDGFGIAVALDGGVLAVGASGREVARAPGTWWSDAGAVFVYRAGPDGFALERTVVASDPSHFDQFGASLDLSDGTLIVGAPAKHVGGPNQGRAYIFEGEDFAEVMRLSGLSSGDMFGWSVAIDGTRAIVGAPHRDSPAFDGGAAYLFERRGIWTGDGSILPQVFAITGQLGAAVAISGGRALAGAPGERGYAGAAYLATRGETTWSAERLLMPDVDGFDLAGLQVEIEDDLALVAAPWANGSHEGSGTVAAFDATNGAYLEEFHAPDSGGGDLFGIGLAIHEGRVAIGAPAFDQPEQWLDGRAYVYGCAGLTAAVIDVFDRLPGSLGSAASPLVC